MSRDYLYRKEIRSEGVDEQMVVKMSRWWLRGFLGLRSGLCRFRLRVWGWFCWLGLR